MKALMTIQFGCSNKTQSRLLSVFPREMSSLKNCELSSVWRIWIQTDSRRGATYNAIRDWIKAKYGYRVTNLNIAQVKQKHGIIERENYNKPKSPDSKQPGCPEEKVKAIEDAMRHYQMI